MTEHFTQRARPSDQLPLPTLVTYLSEYLPDFMINQTLHVTQFSGGVSNLTYRLSNGENSIVLRRPPNGKKARSAHDMSREFKVLSHIQPLYPVAPKPLLLCKDESILGSEFFIMAELPGLTVGKSLPIEMTEAKQNVLCENFIDQFIALHSIDIRQPELAKLGKPEGYVERQLEGWQMRYQDVKTDDIPQSETVYRWLQMHLPFNSGLTTLVHNDFKFDNLILNPNKPEEITGVLDWEMTTLGDPLLDVGCSLAYWVQASDSTELQSLRRIPTHLPGMMSRQEIFDRYCEKRGIQGVNFTPYYVFGLFRLAVIGQQIYYRYYNGQTDNPAFKHFGQLVGILFKTALSEARAFNT